MKSTTKREQKRVAGLENFAIDKALTEFSARYPALKLPPVVALICAFEEEDNIGDVLKAVPAEACGLPVAPLVIVDGGRDATAQVSLDAGAITCAFPTNLGHGVALQVGYRLAVDGGARYVVTLDADGQNDPAELPVVLEALVDGSADFVVASRRLDHEPLDRVTAERHLERLPRPERAAPGRRRRPARAAPVPDGRAADHGHLAGLAGHRAPDGLEAPGVGDVQEGLEPVLRVPLRQRGGADHHPRAARQVRSASRRVVVGGLQALA